jgi:acyl-CoA thioester hydrolase
MSVKNSNKRKYLTAELVVPVRFSETDAMGVIWHGNYLKFFEDAREDFGKTYGMEYLDFYDNGFFTPIVESKVNYKSPIYYGESIKVKIKLIYSSAAKLIFHYTVLNLTTNAIAATGSTVQVFILKDKRELILYKPKFYEEWEKKVTWLIEK